MARRADSWKMEEDLLVKDTVIQHIKEGKKLKDAFKLLTELLETRTESAIKFRWHKILSHQYHDEVKKAKEIKKTIPPIKSITTKGNKSSDSLALKTNQPIINLDPKTYQQLQSYVDYLVKEKYKHIIKENEKLKEKVALLRDELNSYKEIRSLIQEFNKIVI